MQNTFTSQEAVSLFKENTGFEFHPTVPGQLLARCGIEKISSTKKPSQFDAEHWKLVWEEMFHLALRRCRFDKTLQPPKTCLAPVLRGNVILVPTPKKVKAALAAPMPGTLPDATEMHDLKPHPIRQFLDVPFEEKDEAKWRGAKWDATFRKWYVPTGLSRNLFRWPDALMTPAMRAVEFPRDQPGKRPRRKAKAGSDGKPTVADQRLQKELEGRLQFLLEKPD